MNISIATQQLLDACYTEDLSAVKAAIASGADVTVYTFDQHKFSPALIAATCGNLEILKYLVEESGQTIDLTAEGNLLVRSADDDGHEETVSWLINESPQALAIQQDQDPEVQACVEKYLDPGLRRLQELFNIAQTASNDLRRQCFSSAVCRKAAAAGAVTTIEQFEELLTKAPQPTIASRKL